ncbi:hypothetical protein [Pseudomonas sp. NPDC007930]|uniref:hypothetical protein n=1 Tax=Pseudomonas sp. NPDC007930 TaxID=3364417 RepID=UPI0036E6183E
MLAPLHMCEITVRNAVAEALCAVYGPRWPWQSTFEMSLPMPKGPGYNPRRDLIDTRKRVPTPDRVIVELKFKFWESLFTRRHDARVWIPQLFTTFPHLPRDRSVAEHRQRLADDLKSIRLLRNRIAHHEPIFNRKLAEDLSRAKKIVAARCGVCASWMLGEQLATAAIGANPL